MGTVELEIEPVTATDVLGIEDLLSEVPRDKVEAARYVAFYFGENLYCLPAAEVTEVTHPLAVSPLPNGPASLHGISQHRGEIVAIIALRNLLAENESHSASRVKFVVLRSAEGDTRIAFPVDRMHEFIALNNKELLPGSDSKPFVGGQAKFGDSLVNLLDIEKIKTTINAQH